MAPAQSGRLLPALERTEEALLVGSIALTFATLVLQVFSRYLANLPLAWTEELARYLFIWSVFLGASQAMRHGEHIAIGILIERLPRAAAAAAALAMNLLCGAFLLVVAVKGWELADKVAELPSTAMEISMAFVYAPLPLTALTMLARLVGASWTVLAAGPTAIQHRSL